MSSSRGQTAALISPNWDLLRVKLDLPSDTTSEQLAQREDVAEFMTAEVRKQTNDLATYEQIRLITVLPHEFSVESGELSPAMKIKRRVVESRYAAEIDRAYGVGIGAPTPV